MPTHIGTLRRSQVVGTYGPGAIVDFRAKGKQGVPISGVIAGLEEWDRAAPKGHPGNLHRQSIHEPRLEKRLMVSGFRLPPIREDDDPTSDVDVLPVVLFPTWLQCPSCDSVGRATGRDRRWKQDGGKPERFCPECTDQNGRTQFVVPVRFIVACADGHLDEFPWQVWIGCRCRVPDLRLRVTGAGLGGKVLSCETEECKAVERAKSLEGAFSRDALTRLGLKCRGHRPWLEGEPDQNCKSTPRVLQRGASNVFWGESVSSLDIPPFSVDLGTYFGKHALTFEGLKDPALWSPVITSLGVTQETGHPMSVLIKVLESRQKALANDLDEPIELAEYRQFRHSELHPVDEGEFQTRAGPVPPELELYFGSVILAHRLREVRAMVGFTRIHPPSGPFRSAATRPALLSRAKLPWLPAIELRGEGVFLRFNPEALTAWEELESVRQRARILEDRIRSDLFEGEEMPDCSPRFLLVHSFSHALIRQLSLDCGYSSSALRERLYVGRGELDMAGVLIHTGSPDSEGTLGGLVRQGREEHLVHGIRGALRSMGWCAQDPLCITGSTTLSSTRNQAACHACLLIPETSCQHFNTRLDRGLLVGMPGTSATDRETGFFRALVDEAGE